MEFWDLMRVAVAAGVVGLDRLALGQFMVSQPIVAAPLIGWLLGDFHVGLWVGVVLELFWLGGLPVGGYVPKDATLAAVLTTGLILVFAPWVQEVEPAWMAWVFLWVGLLLIPAGVLDKWIRKKNAWLIKVAASPSSSARAVSKAIKVGVSISFLYYFLITLFVLMFSGPMLIRGFSALSEEMRQGLRLFFFLLPAVGIASLLAHKDIGSGRSKLMAGGVASFLVFVGFGQQNIWALVMLFLLAGTMIIMKERRRVSS